MIAAKRNVFSFIFLLLGISLLIMGVFRTEQETVLMKAVNICLECIGIG